MMGDFTGLFNRGHTSTVQLFDDKGNAQTQFPRLMVL